MKSPYTKQGDKGKTNLIGNKKVNKDNPHIETLGTIDELNSLLGVTISFRQKKSQETKLLKSIQADLIKISSLLANPKTARENNYLKQKIEFLEKIIDKKTNKLPPLKEFVIPGGKKTTALLHLNRAVCRRAERRVVTLSQKEKINPQILIYLNRLSDFLFVLSLDADKKR